MIPLSSSVGPIINAPAASPKIMKESGSVTSVTRDALEDGTIDVAIDQRPEIELNRALALLQAIVDDLPPPPAPELIPAIYLRDNLPNELL